MQDLAKAACGNVVDLSMLVPGDDFTGSKYGAHFEGSANVSRCSRRKCRCYKPYLGATNRHCVMPTPEQVLGSWVC